METLIEKSTTDKMRIYYHKGLDRPYLLYVNDILDGDPCYAYRTLKGAKLAMRKFEKGRYKGKPSKRTVYLRDGFQFASLDGELIDLTTREAGVWEGKTVLADNSLVWEEWKDQMPQDYYAQILHQLLVTERKFSVINPEFRWLDMETNEIRTSVRRMTIRAADKDIASDMKYLDEAEHEFWGYVTRRERPPLILPQF